MKTRICNLILRSASIAVLLGSCALAQGDVIVTFDVDPSTGTVEESGVTHQITGDISWDATTGEALGGQLFNGVPGQPNYFYTGGPFGLDSQFTGPQTLSGPADTLDFFTMSGAFTSREFIAFTLETPGPGNYTGQDLILAPATTGDVTLNAGNRRSEVDFSFKSLTFVPENYSPAAPEPSTFVLGMLGMAGLGFVKLRKKFRRV
jgi:hypothetical protein